MNGWMILWCGVLGFGILGFLTLILVVSVGAISELKLTLEDLRADAQESAEHPETLDEAV